jgi:hypothetical protein
MTARLLRFGGVLRGPIGPLGGGHPALTAEMLLEGVSV